MKTVVHVTHEAVNKIGGIGAVIHGLITSKVYRAAVKRDILLGPLFSTDGPAEGRLYGGKVLYSGVDGIRNHAFRQRLRTHRARLRRQNRLRDQNLPRSPDRRHQRARSRCSSTSATSTPTKWACSSSCSSRTTASRAASTSTSGISSSIAASPSRAWKPSASSGPAKTATSPSSSATNTWACPRRWRRAALPGPVPHRLLRP